MKSVCTNLILSLFLAGTACAQSILFQERFPNGVPEHFWQAGFNGRSILPVAFPGNPSGDGWVGRLANDLSGGNVGQSSAENVSFSDFHFEANVFIPVNGAVYYGIEFRVDPSGLSAGYQFVAAFNPSGTRRMRFRARPYGSPAVPTAIRDWSPTEIPGGMPTVTGWHKLGVKAIGTLFWFYFNGNELPGCPVYDNTFFTGSVGAYLWDMSSSAHQLFIDDLLVTEVGGTDVQNPLTAQDFVLNSVYPNPVPAGIDTRVLVSFDLRKTESLALTVVDILGRSVLAMPVMRMEPGSRLESVDIRALPAGTYRMRLSSTDQIRETTFVILQ